jgi:hypothetical protein
MTVEREYDTLACQVAIARKALSGMDEILQTLRLRRMALAAEAEAREHEYTDYLLAHAEEIREIKARRLADTVEGRP